MVMVVGVGTGLVVRQGPVVVCAGVSGGCQRLGHVAVSSVMSSERDRARPAAWGAPNSAPSFAMGARRPVWSAWVLVRRYPELYTWRPLVGKMQDARARARHRLGLRAREVTSAQCWSVRREEGAGVRPDSGEIDEPLDVDGHHRRGLSARHR